MTRIAAFALAALPALLLAACAANPALREADALARRGEHESAWRLLSEASRAAPQDAELRVAAQRQRDLGLLALATQAENARAGGQLDVADELLQRMQALDPQAPRTRALQSALRRARSHEARLASASQQLQAGQLDAAREAITAVLAEDPGQPQALALQRKLRQRYAPPPLPSTLAAAYQKPVSLEFRDAPLRTVFEALGRGAGINFVFDKDVKADARVSLYLKDVSVDEAMRVVLGTQQLERKLLNENSVLIYPNTAQKLREHQELVTRSFYLNNADVKQAQALVRMMAKTRDLFIDERLNLLVARDTPEVIAMIEQLVAGLDLPEPEVMLDVEVLELGTDRTDEAGLNWATDASFGSLDGAAMVPWSARGSFRTLVANPVVAARLKGASGSSNLLASPKLRARNKEKAKIQIGDRVPVFTSTSTANVGVSTAVTYIDVGLKLEVEPTVQLDNEVIMKVNLEVSSLGPKESSGGPQPTSAYRIGSRTASTSLRLRDGETQVLAGLINDEDRKNVSGLPYASEAPLLGRLFGVHTDSRKKTEIVLLITPHVLRNIGLPEASQTILPSGFDANPGAQGLRLRSPGSVAAPLAGSPPHAGSGPAAVARSPGEAVVEMQTSANAAVGETLSVGLTNTGAASVKGTLTYDVSLFTRADAGGAEASSGSVDVELPPQGQKVLLLRARPGAAGQSGMVEFVNARAANAKGEALPVRVEGEGHVEIRAN
ncbi:general secretion pathway protein GspD [Pelomonas sp. P7]|uniref:General secretion pathway protein GspD n=1 Tax=Pelomonas caseinilytica TaxID=2906763 RepID=A0ABS8XGU4_9BURK|nr:secretin N-terminal domain-containing protein [Pelomonas sp. P7]MCE4538051.1 general secretion pathway protein GspD [Pelomonas sp. P7]